MLNQQFHKVNQLVVHQKVRTTAIKMHKTPETIKSVHFIGFGYSEKFSNLKDKDWILTLAFLVDICDHLNVLNLSLQGKNNLFPDAIFIEEKYF